MIGKPVGVIAVRQTTGGNFTYFKKGMSLYKRLDDKMGSRLLLTEFMRYDQSYMETLCGMVVLSRAQEGRGHLSNQTSQMYPSGSSLNKAVNTAGNGDSLQQPAFACQAAPCMGG